ncbi:MAG TPA: hypothetical protein VGC65_10250 [Bacteroidia bacterium]|jgi:hypothetical protein
MKDPKGKENVIGKKDAEQGKNIDQDKNINEENSTPGYRTEEIQDGFGIDDEDQDIIHNGKSNLDPEDLTALGPPDLSMDGGDDEDLLNRSYPVDFTGHDLDVPGTELDDPQEDIGSEDEENNIYSSGDIQ